MTKLNKTSTTSLANTFNNIFYDSVLNNDKSIRDNIKDIITFCQTVKEAKTMGKLNQFLLVVMPYMIIEDTQKLKNGTDKVKLKLVRSGSFKNYLTFIYNIADNSDILINDFMKSTNKISELSGLSTFINNVKNPKNKEAKNKPQVMASKDVKTSSEVEASKELLDAQNLSNEDFKALFNSCELSQVIELRDILENVIASKNTMKIKKQA